MLRSQLRWRQALIFLVVFAHEESIKRQALNVFKFKTYFPIRIKVCKVYAKVRFFFALDNGFSLPVSRQIEAGFYEALQNVIQHAYLGAKDKPIETELRLYSDRFEIHIQDKGVKVPRSEIKARPLDDVRTSGLGLYLMENFFDELNYDTSSQPEGTRLTMIKRIQTD